MRIEVRLFATLARYLPAENRTGDAFVDMADGSTVADVTSALGIPADLSRIVLVNGEEADEDRPLNAGDVVTLFPPLAGGLSLGDTLERLHRGAEGTIGSV